MKLALVTRRYPPLIGGAEKVLSYLAAALAAEGAEVTVLTSRMPGLELAEREDVPVEAEEGRRRDAASAGRLTVVRLATSRLRFWGTWLYMRNLRRWFEQNPVDLAYVSMLKHDAYVTVGVGRRLGFPVVLRPEGAGATGDIAWQSWGNFGRKIGRRCRRAAAFVAISKAIEDELRSQARWKPARIADRSAVAAPDVGAADRGDAQRRPGPGEALAAAPRLARGAPRGVRRPAGAEKGLDTLIDAWPAVRAASRPPG